MCCSVLQCVAVGSDPLFVAAKAASICSVLQCVAVCCRVLQCVAGEKLQVFAVCCRVLQCIAAGREPLSVAA